MGEEYFSKIIDSVHERWLLNKEKYPTGYAVFYSPVKFNPELLVIGMNPGGGEEAWLDKGDKYKESIMKEGVMEYFEYDYALATKTRRFFEEAGYEDLLKYSLKTNLNFFRSKDWQSLSMQDFAFCADIIKDIVLKIRPKVIFCESIFVSDWIGANIYSPGDLVQTNELKTRMRRYLSYKNTNPELPNTLIGVAHLSASRWSNKDFDKAKLLLKQDLNISL